MVEYILASNLKLLVVTITVLWRFFYDGTDEEYCKHINWNILGGDVMNISLIIIKGK